MILGSPKSKIITHTPSLRLVHLTSFKGNFFFIFKTFLSTNSSTIIQKDTFPPFEPGLRRQGLPGSGSDLCEEKKLGTETDIREKKPDPNPILKKEKNGSGSYQIFTLKKITFYLFFSHKN